jgi:Uma2 family endonuclease
MTSLLIKTEPADLKVDLAFLTASLPMTDEQFYQFCLSNPDLRIERSALGEITIMPPAFSDTGNRNFKISHQVGTWAEQDGMGEVFDSSSGFTLTNGATRSPDTAWILADRWNALTPEEQASFAPIVPDFVIELRSSSDTLKGLQEKMEEYIENGVRLGLLIDRKNRRVHCYRPGKSPEVLENPEHVICDPELVGFELKMAKIW